MSDRLADDAINARGASDGPETELLQQRARALAGALAALRWCLTASGTGLVLLIPVQALHAASFGAAHLAAMHHIQDSTPPALQASAQGFYAAFGIALLFGLVTPAAGWLYGSLGGAAFLVMAALALIGTVLAGALASTQLVPS